MTNDTISFWATVRLLLGATRKRGSGRRRRQQEILNQRKKGSKVRWGVLGIIASTFFMALLHLFAAFGVMTTVDSAQSIAVQRQGKYIVNSRFLGAVRGQEGSSSSVSAAQNSTSDNDDSALDYSYQAERIAEATGEKKELVEQELRDEVRLNGSRNLVSRKMAEPGIKALMKTGALPKMMGSVLLLLWLTMLVCQGEGLELDLQRRRHPMWEWLFTHPVQPGAVFLAEMLSPIAANPIYWSAPLFVGVLYGRSYDLWHGLLAGALIGVPIVASAACLGKALEIGALLRLSPRSRGAAIGIISWLGYATMMFLFIGWSLIPKVIGVAGRLIDVFAELPWPWLAWFLGGAANGHFIFWHGLLTCWFAAGVVGTAAVWFSAWGAQRGLSGNFAADKPSAPKRRSQHFGSEPLFRKEFLWFVRDRSAIVQTILIPISVAGIQMFNLRGILHHAQNEWNSLCGVAIFFGTYFLWVLGPKSLTSEGSALWIALTWPKGMESLLKAKAWLWSMLSCGLVALVLAYACFAFPHDIWKIATVGVGWFFFSRSMAEKSVTLVTVLSESGEAQKIPSGRRWAAQLGMLTFAIGVLTEQWHIAVMGIVYSYVTAAAMWENFRARLPYLYDPWSEEVPPAPTLMHAMIAISVLVEGGAVLTGLLYAFGGRNNIAIAQTIGYGAMAVLVSYIMAKFLENRDVEPEDVWCWRSENEPRQNPQWSSWLQQHGLTGAQLPSWLLTAAGGGLVLGLFSHLYLFVLRQIPATGEIIRRSNEAMSKVPNLHLSYAIMAIGFAPFAEEYLFRGLLFRALDREWGGWLAILGSAAFFAIYHPVLSWIPVAMLGAANALIFKKSGRLAPAVLLHMVYNAVVMS